MIGQKASRNKAAFAPFNRQVVSGIVTKIAKYVNGFSAAGRLAGRTGGPTDGRVGGGRQGDRAGGRVGGGRMDRRAVGRTDGRAWNTHFFLLGIAQSWPPSFMLNN